jgi:hypothetical protein
MSAPFRSHARNPSKSVGNPPRGGRQQRAGQPKVLGDAKLYYRCLFNIKHFYSYIFGVCAHIDK